MLSHFPYQEGRPIPAVFCDLDDDDQTSNPKILLSAIVHTVEGVNCVHTVNFLQPQTDTE